MKTIKKSDWEKLALLAERAVTECDRFYPDHVILAVRHNEKLRKEFGRMPDEVNLGARAIKIEDALRLAIADVLIKRTISSGA